MKTKFCTSDEVFMIVAEEMTLAVQGPYETVQDAFAALEGRDIAGALEYSVAFRLVDFEANHATDCLDAVLDAAAKYESGWQHFDKITGNQLFGDFVRDEMNEREAEGEREYASHQRDLRSSSTY